MAQVSPDRCDKQECMIVVDVGSTGSRIHLYAYDLDANHSPVGITEQWSNKVNPGFATLEAKNESVNAYLDSLFSGLKVSKVPVYFYATAGMRLLSQTNQKKLYLLAQDWFASHPDWPLTSAKTIPGSEEGLYGWLAVNYQNGTLQNGTDTAGVLDIGGASVQVSFPVKDTAGIDPRDLQQVALYGHQTKVFIHSFLGLGQNEVMHQYMNSSDCFPIGYELPDGGLAQGNALTCAESLQKLIQSVHQVDKTVKPVQTANPVKHWYALGGVVGVSRSKALAFDKSFTSAELLEKSDVNICQRAWSELSETWSGDDYLYSYCLLAAYHYSLFVNGYGLSDTQPVQLPDASHSSDWTLGVVLGSKNSTIH